MTEADELGVLRIPKRPAAATAAAMLAIVYVLWGSTSPAMKVAVASLPPFWMAAVRFAIAGSVLWAICRVRGVAMPSAADVRGATVTGAMLLVFSNGVFAWTLQWIPSGLGSLVFALAPLWMTVLAFLIEGERLRPLAAVGLALGLGGMAYLFSPAGAQHLPAVPLGLALLAAFTWALGSVMQRRMRRSDVAQISALQMLAGAAGCAFVALLSGEPFRREAFTPAALGALGYLVVFGSLIGFSSYLWLMNNLPTALVATYAYVNPIVALCIGIGILHEPFSWRLVGGAAFVLSGVALMLLAAGGPHSGRSEDDGHALVLDSS